MNLKAIDFHRGLAVPHHYHQLHPCHSHHPYVPHGHHILTLDSGALVLTYCVISTIVIITIITTIAITVIPNRPPHSHLG